MKKVLLAIFVLLALVVGGVLFYFSSDGSDPYGNDFSWGRFAGNPDPDNLPADDMGNEYVGCDLTVPPEEIPTFTEVPFPHSNVFDNTKSLPLMACALIDFDGDGVDEVFVSGGITQNDKLFKFGAKGFSDISDAVSLPKKTTTYTTFGAVSFDLDKNGHVDLLLTGDNGITWLKNDGEKFEAQNIEIQLNETSVSATLTVGDYNKDGHADLFLANYIPLDKMEGQTIFKDPNYGATSQLLKNNGDNTFTNVTTEAGLDYVHNTFQAVFIDIDLDSNLDLVIAYDTGEARTYKNNGDGTFTLKSNPTTGKYAYPMGIAVGDYNNDGYPDFFFSNTGSSVPKFLARGDLEEEDVFNSKWILLENQGGFKFKDAAKQARISDYEFSWGALFQDFNLDGLQDLVVAENYVDFPPHKLFKLPCRLLIQREHNQFAAVEQQAGVINENYAISPFASDFNQDGYPDLFYSNLNGTMKAWINNGGKNHYIGVRFPETAEHVGSSITVELESGQKMTEYYIIGEGLSSDQSATLNVGIGAAEAVKSLTINYPSGEQKVVESPEIDMVHLVSK